VGVAAKGEVVQVGKTVAVEVDETAAGTVTDDSAVGVPVSSAERASAVCVYWTSLVCCLNSTAVLVAALAI
jgi:predicted RecA/RadA family phage recombinase